MNQRIHELALQAGGSHFPTVGGANLEKFAELLVKECIDICLTGTDTQMTSQGAAQKIRQHFGIQ
jgi:hypothetical protein